MIDLSKERLVADMETQAEIGGTDDGGLDRVTLSADDGAARDWFRDRMEDAGLAVRVDEMGNMFGRRTGSDPDAAPVLVGSHLDSQPKGGIYDGALGIVAALELVRTLDEEGIETTHPIEIVNWTNEEGTRFNQVMQGSGVWSGALDRDEEYDRRDGDGTRFETALKEIGYKGDEPAAPREDYEAALELHIEQGPRLEENDLDVGVVSGLVGISWGEVRLHGQSNHSGPTPMHRRQDALAAAAELITRVRSIVNGAGEATVGTVGDIAVEPGSINVIPERTRFTWDVRDLSDDVVDSCIAAIEREASTVADREGVEAETERLSRTHSVRFPDRIVETVERATSNLGYDAMRLVGGAVHDAGNVARVCDAGMVFAVSEDGISHAEAEYTSWTDCHTAANTLANTALDLAR